MSNNGDMGTTINTDEAYYQHTGEENKNSYQYLGKKLGLSNIELFLITVLIGKCIVKNREKINKTVTFIKYESALNSGEVIKILKILAIEECNDINILENKPEMFKIWEEYAVAGMKEFCNWYHSNSTEIEVKLGEEMINIFNSLSQN